ncbi:MAG: sigma 54-interacting transcriptional regulator [Sutterellaceae bacterium]|nr:sigma 54-interacting transcriptional regulator [Sutterellaceae bacterium]
MAVSSELACMLEAVSDPAFLIRADDMTVACVNSAFSRVFGAFGFEGKQCWEALHRAGNCAACGLGCPLAQAAATLQEAQIQQTVYASAYTTRYTVTMRPILSSDGKVVYWLERIAVKKGLGVMHDSRGYVGVSLAHQKTVHEMAKCAGLDSPVWVCGESGTGKELYARTVHENSPRASQPFVAVEACDLTDENARDLLCGRSDKTKQRVPGLFSRAEGGTLFIDSAESLGKTACALLTQAVQKAKLKQRRSFRLMASSRYCLSEIQTGKKLPSAFSDLFSTDSVHVAALRERKEDIAPLARHFIRGIAPYNTYKITEEALEVLTHCDWPGNMRSLRNTLVIAAEHCQDQTIRAGDIALERDQEENELFRPGAEIVTLEALKERYLGWVLEQFKGPRAELAKKLGLSQRTFYRLAAEVRKNEP